MATKKDYRVIDGKVQRVDIEIDENMEVVETQTEELPTQEELELIILSLKEKELKQRIETERKISGLAFPLTILAWVAIVSLVINILFIIAYV